MSMTKLEKNLQLMVSELKQQLRDADQAEVINHSEKYKFMREIIRTLELLLK